MRNKSGALALSLSRSALFATGAFAADPVGEPGREAGGKNPLKNVYFGEQHLHSMWSADAYATGTRQKPEDAYRWALKDPDSGNLDRIQIIKGWYENGYPQEKIYDVALSDDRKPDPRTGKVASVGNTVNIKEATYTNDIGDSQLSAVWTDPDFKPEHHAVYYVRVLEIPTPRWSTYDAKALGIAPPEGVEAAIQERAWASPIWYTPEAKLVKKAPAYPNLHQIVN